MNNKEIFNLIKHLFKVNPLTLKNRINPTLKSELMSDEVYQLLILNNNGRYIPRERSSDQDRVKGVQKDTFKGYYQAISIGMDNVDEAYRLGGSPAMKFPMLIELLKERYGEFTFAFTEGQMWKPLELGFFPEKEYPAGTALYVVVKGESDKHNLLVLTRHNDKVQMQYSLLSDFDECSADRSSFLIFLPQ